MRMFMACVVPIFVFIKIVASESDLQQQNLDYLNPVNEAEHHPPKDQDKRTIFPNHYGWAKHVGIHPAGFKYVIGYGPVDLKYVPVVKPISIRPHHYHHHRPRLHIKPVAVRPLLPIRPVVHHDGWKPVVPIIKPVPVNVPAPAYVPHKPWQQQGWISAKPVHVVRPVPVVPVKPVHHVPVKPVVVPIIPSKPLIPAPPPVVPVVPQVLVPHHHEHHVVHAYQPPHHHVVPVNPVPVAVPPPHHHHHVVPLNPVPVAVPPPHHHHHVVPVNQVPVAVPPPHHHHVVPVDQVPLTVPPHHHHLVPVNQVPVGLHPHHHHHVVQVPVPEPPLHHHHELVPEPPLPHHHHLVPAPHQHHFVPQQPHEQHDVQTPLIPQDHPIFQQQLPFGQGHNLFQQPIPEQPTVYQQLPAGPQVPTDQQLPQNAPVLFNHHSAHGVQHHFNQQIQHGDSATSSILLQGSIQPGQTDLQIPVHLPQHPNYLPDGGRQFQPGNFHDPSQHPDAVRPAFGLEPPFTHK